MRSYAVFLWSKQNESQGALNWNNCIKVNHFSVTPKNNLMHEVVLQKYIFLDWGKMYIRICYMKPECLIFFSAHSAATRVITWARLRKWLCTEFEWSRDNPAW